jgi:aminopeptidase N
MRQYGDMPSLTRAEAERRAQLLRVDGYQIDLDLTRGPEVFGSTTTIRFRAAEPGAGTFLDLAPRALAAVTLNGRALDPAALADRRFPLTGLAADNELVVQATMAYTNTGQGLHRFVDPADGGTYLYSAAFLDQACTIFACFEQPDLKAPVALRVTAPPQWTVVGNGAARLPRPGRWEFATTPPLATYLMALVAGEYHGVHTVHDGVPMSLYARRSLAEHLDREAPELLEVTKAALDRYHELFGVRYPFGKYDQAFVPEFTMGAMENPGCVTFRDDLVFRAAVSEARRELRAVIIAHEMAHMWFGDLVTMRWWDDLWLNESFAEYLGHRVTAEVTRFRDAWSSFAVGRKAWGYAADERPSTHPVASDVHDAEQALLNFDGISYAKGAAILRQLVAWLGDEVFLDGLREHVKAHAYGNATLADLVAALDRASGRDLGEWARVWLREAGVNTLRPVVVGDEVGIIQEGEVPRPHRLGIGWYGRDGRATARVEMDLTATLHSGRLRVPDRVRPGDVLLLNDGDLSYAKVRLADWASLPDLLPQTPDPLTRAVLWGAAWEAVRDAVLPADFFVDLLVRTLPAESHATVFEHLLGHAWEHAIPRYLTPVAAPAAARTLAELCASIARRGDARRRSALHGWIAGSSDTGALRAALSGAGLPAGVVLDVELRWALLRRLSVLGDVCAAEIDEEYARDLGAAGAEHAAWCHAARPDPEAKARAWTAVMVDKTLSNRLLFVTAEGFWQPDQRGLTESYVDRYAVDVPTMARRRPAQVAGRLATLGYPRYAVAPGTLTMSKRMLARDDLTPAVRRAVVDATHDLRRSLAAQALARAGTPGGTP